MIENFKGIWIIKWFWREFVYENLSFEIANEKINRVIFIGEKLLMKLMETHKNMNISKKGNKKF